FLPLSSNIYDFMQTLFDAGVAITANVVVIAAITQIPGAWAGLKRRALRRTTPAAPVITAAPSRGEDETKAYFQ
ncbi:hypothetical protein PMAYCL1PPCAC_20187, partial [Pristionchus mayeri]